MIIAMISGMIDDHHVQNICSLNVYYIFACLYNMSLVVRIPVFGGFRPGPIQTGLYYHTRWLEAGNFVF